MVTRCLQVMTICLTHMARSGRKMQAAGSAAARCAMGNDMSSLKCKGRSLRAKSLVLKLGNAAHTNHIYSSSPATRSVRGMCKMTLL